MAQPGMAGTSAQYPPSAASCTTTLSFIGGSSWVVAFAALKGHRVPTWHQGSVAQRASPSTAAAANDAATRTCSRLQSSSVLLANIRHFCSD